MIHISERDTQVSSQPKAINEFVNTWSIEGFYEEGTAPAELGWGTHERRLPKHAHAPIGGPGNQIFLAQPGIRTFVHSWVPSGGPIIGMVVRHAESFTISDHLTVWEDTIEGRRPVYRPTVHYAYMPCDNAILSLYELTMRNFQLQPKLRIMSDEITDGIDELGVLLMGHGLTGWWTGSQLDIHETRRLVPGQNATTLQVAAAVLAALVFMIGNPRKGILVPDELPHKEILDVAGAYLGPCPSVQTNWTPLESRSRLFAKWGAPAVTEEDLWQFRQFRRRTVTIGDAVKLTDLRGILQYIPQFREKTFILAIDGAIVTDDNFATLLLDVALLWSLNIRVVLVHGASAQIRSLADERNIKASDFDGTGVTDAATLDLALTAANRLTHEILEGLSANDLRAAYDERDHRASRRHHPGRRPSLHGQGRARRCRVAPVAARAGRRAGHPSARLRRRRQDLPRELRRRGAWRWPSS